MPCALWAEPVTSPEQSQELLGAPTQWALPVSFAPPRRPSVAAEAGPTRRSEHHHLFIILFVIIRDSWAFDSTCWLGVLSQDSISRKVVFPDLIALHELMESSVLHRPLSTFARVGNPCSAGGGTVAWRFRPLSSLCLFVPERLAYRSGGRNPRIVFLLPCVV